MEPQNISIAEKAWLEWQRSSNSQDGCSRVVFSNDGRDYEIDFVSMKQRAFMRVGTEGRVRRVVLHGDLLAPSQSTAQISGTTFHVASCFSSVGGTGDFITPCEVVKQNPTLKGFRISCGKGMTDETGVAIAEALMRNVTL